MVTCFDARFDLAIRKFLKRRGIVVFDDMKIPGAVRTSMLPHGSRRLMIMAHNDCGAYRGVSAEAVVADARPAP